MFWLFALSIFTYFLQGIEGLPGLAITLWAKESLNMPAHTVQSMLAWTSIAWLIKPFWGYFTDSFFTKKKWIVFSIIGGMLICTLLSFLPIQSLVMLVCLMAILNWTMAIRDVAVDGIACIKGKADNNNEKYQAAQWGAIAAAGILATLGGGYIAEKLHYSVGFLLLIPLYLPMFYIIHKAPNVDCAKAITKLKDYKGLLRKDFLLVSLFLFVYKTAPAFGTMLTYVKRDTFKWSAMQIAYLDVFVLSIELVIACLFAKYFKRLSIKKILIWSIIIGVPTTLAYLHFTPTTAWIYGGMFGTIGMIVHLACMTFMAKNSLDGLESTSFAMLCSVSNFAGWCSLQLGAFTLNHWGLDATIIISAFMGLAALPLVKYVKW